IGGDHEHDRYGSGRPQHLPCGRAAGQDDASNVRFGSEADICAAKSPVCFTPKSGHVRYSKKLPGARPGLLSSVQAIRIIAMGRALVIGGSLGGLFGGLLLRQSGWDVAVFERSNGDLASRGVGIGTHVEQFEIMRRLGITVDERIGVAVTSRICLDRDGAVIARLPFEKTLTSWALFYR